MSSDIHVLVVEADFYRYISDALLEGALEVLDAAGCSYDVVQVPGCLEIPAAIRFDIKSAEVITGRRRYDACVALGCVIRGAPSHYDTVQEGIARVLLAPSLPSPLAAHTGTLN